MSSPASASHTRGPGTARGLTWPLTAAGRGLASALLVALTVAGTVALVALPYGWIIGVAKLNEVVAIPALISVPVVLVGIPLSMVGGVKLLLLVNDAYERVRGNEPPAGRRAPVWRRGLTDTARPRQLRMLDVVMIVSVCAAVLAFCIWFVVLGGSSVRL